nr:gliding motility-associated C-terminal domain-containing protein [Chitinophagaceae bacterium]
WQWDFGNPNATNDTSRLRNPAYTFPAPGTYQVTLRATSSKGCDKSVTLPLQVFDRPSLSLPFRDTLICSIDSLPLIATGNGSFSWTPSTGRILNPNTPNPVVFPLSTTTYRVTLNDRGCIASDSIRVNVLDFISVDAGRDTTICAGDPVVLNPVTAGLSFSWSPAPLLNNPNIRRPVAIPTDRVTRFVVIANLGKCQAVDSLTITTVPYPEAFVMPDTTICNSTSIQLSGSGNGSFIQWSPSNGLSAPNSYQTIATPTGTTTYTLSVFDNLGCPKPGIATVTINVTPPITVNAGQDTTVVFGQTLQLAAQSNANQFEWTPAIGLNDPAILSPTLTLTASNVPPGTDFITYSLRAFTPEGCTNSDSVTIRVFSTGPSIFIPNAFTPNNDGLNDVIRPILAGIQRLDFFRIYNRYGQLVFQTSQSEAGWDGTLKGLPQNSGNYVYQVQAIDIAGEVLRQSGSFILIR